MITNLGSVFLVTLPALLIICCSRVVNKFKQTNSNEKLCPLLAGFLRRQTDSIFWNGIISYIQENYMLFMMSILLSLL